MRHRRAPRTLFGRALVRAELTARTPGVQRIPYWPREPIDDLVERRLLDTVRTACQHVPWYRARLEAGDLNPHDIRSPADLHRWPTVDAQQVHREPESLLSDQWNRDDCIRFQSSGSSGYRKTIYLEPNTFLANAVYETRSRSVIKALAGRARALRTLTIAPLTSNEQRLKDMYRKWLAIRSSGPSVSRVDNFAPFEDKLAEVNRIRPDVVGGVTGVVSSFFMEVLDRGVGCHRPKLLRLGVEGFPRGHRERLKRELGIPAVLTYASSECTKIGFECEERNGYHIHEDFCLLRVVDDDNNDLPEGDVGHILITNLANRGTMLINYQQGDKGYVSREPCPCGRTFARVFLTQAKETPLLKAPNGRVVHYGDLLRPIIGYPEFVRLQVVVESPDFWRLLVESEDIEASKQWIHTTVDPLMELTGGSVRVEVEFTRDFVMSPISGKQSPVIIRDAAHIRSA